MMKRRNNSRDILENAGRVVSQSKASVDVICLACLAEKINEKENKTRRG
jgi:hypothetical protein